MRHVEEIPTPHERAPTLHLERRRPLGEALKKRDMGRIVEQAAKSMNQVLLMNSAMRKDNILKIDNVTVVETGINT